MYVYLELSRSWNLTPSTNSCPGKTISRLMDKAVADEICDSFIYKW